MFIGGFAPPNPRRIYPSLKRITVTLCLRIEDKMKLKVMNIRVSASELFLVEELALAEERGNRSTTLIKSVEHYAKTAQPEIYAKYLENKEKENKATDKVPIRRFRKNLEALKENQKPTDN